MNLLMDYLPAIQFAAALNIGYIIPDIMAKMNSVLNNINNGYVEILQSVRNKIIVKSNEVNGGCVVETKDNRTTKGYINRQLCRLKTIKDGCDEKEQSLSKMISGYVECSGYRSVFFYSAMFSVFALILIPFCKHYDAWTVRMFLYSFNVISCVYLSVLFVKVTVTKKDISCRGVVGFFMFFVLTAICFAYVNRFLPAIIEIGPTAKRLMAGLSIVGSFIPIVGCVLFLTVLVLYATLVARIYAIKAWQQFHSIDRAMKKLNIIDEVFGEDVTTVV